MANRMEYEAIEEKILNPYAVFSGKNRGRLFKEKEHPYRTSFQRDRDRIIHSTAFRRLEYKTQVFIYYEGDYYRNRLTHTIEVQQIARTIARILGINEDITEAISLAHDIGHTPFGHKGESVLNELMKDFGGFEHNKQGLRIVDKLEKRYKSFDGLNLTYEVREGIIKHSTTYDKPGKNEFSEYPSSSLESQVVNFADEIAYTCHDIDDGLKSNIIKEEELEKETIWGFVIKEIKKSLDKEYELKRTAGVRYLINFLVENLIEETEKNIKKYSPKDVEEIRKMSPIAGFNPELNKYFTILKKFLLDNMYMHYRVLRMAEKALMIIEGLFNKYKNEPKILPTHVYSRISSEQKEIIICDYIAGMTDRFAQEEYKKLFYI
ncbi:MAG: deoxyguanosinetriphosphate triphosphohydrolase [Candidatus Omnitrophica bacterium]|jgi:dGTPase|nr:deoxyguanosinetriphosphate triphosphohydrolase [Candidatus Omnitrophota bacterium]